VRRLLAIAMVLVFLLPAIPAHSAPSGTPDTAIDPFIASKIDPAVLKNLGDGGTIEVIVRLVPMPEDVAAKVGGDHDRAVQALKSWAATTQRDVASLVESLGGEVVRAFWIDNVLLVRVPAEALMELASHPSVVKIFPNFEVHIIEPVSKNALKIGPDQTVESWGIYKINAPDAWAKGYLGQGVRIATLDTGVDVTHPALEGKMLTLDPNDPTYPGGWMEFDFDGNPVCSEPHDTHGHGTHVSGTALGGDTSDVLIGVAPSATLMHGLVLPGGSGTFASVLAGIEWAVEPYDCDGNPTGLPAHVISMSLGASGYYGNELLPAIENALLSNVIVVAAIGNDGPYTSSNPGNIWGVYGIGATDENDEVAWFSSGEVVNWPNPPDTWPFYDTYPPTYIKPDFSAPGVGITSAVPGGGYEAWSGTSMATPHVAGTVALILEAMGVLDFNYEDLPETVYEILNASSVDLGDPGQDIRYGWGRIDAAEAVSIAETYAKPGGVEGYVFDAVDNTTVSWAFVHVVEINKTVQVSPEGYFKIGLDPGNYTLVVGGWGYENTTVTVEVIVLDGIIVGQVVDATNGTPIAGANVTVVELNQTAITDENGTFTFTVPPGTYTLTATAEGYQENSTTVRVGENETVVVAIALTPETASPGGTIPISPPTWLQPNLYTYVEVYLQRLPHGFVTGTVLTPEGTPIEGARITVDGTPVSATTGPDGTFTVWLPEGEYTIIVSATAYYEQVFTVTVAANETVDLGEIILVPMPKIAILYDYQLKPVLESYGFYVETFTDPYEAADAILTGEYDVFIWAGHYAAPFPTHDEFMAVHDALLETGTGAVWLDSWGFAGYGIASLSYHTGDPAARSDGWGMGLVYVDVIADHPIFMGVDTSQPVLILNWTGADFSWFDYFSGEVLANLVVESSELGPAIGVKIHEDGTKWVLLASFAPTQWNDISIFTEDAITIIVNSVRYAMAEPLNVTLSNNTVKVGDEVTITVEGGQPLTTYEVYLDDISMGTVTTDEQGTAELTITVPLLPGGEHMVRVFNYTVMQEGVATLTIIPDLAVDPVEIPSPWTVEINITGMGVYENFYIYLDSNWLTTLVADENGHYEGLLNIPAVAPGAHELRIVNLTGHVLAAAEITVTEQAGVGDIADQLSAIQSQLNTINSKIDSKSGQILARLNDLAGLIENSKQETIAVINTKTGTILAKLDELNASISQVVIDRSGEIILILDTKLGAMQASLDALNATVTGVMTDELGNVYATLDTRLGQFEAKLDALNASIADVIVTSKGEIIAVIDDGFTQTHVVLANIQDQLAGIQQEMAQIDDNLMQEIEPEMKSLEEDVNNAKTLSYAATGTAVAAAGLAAFSLIRRP